MTIIVEDGSVVANADAFISVAFADAYFLNLQGVSNSWSARSSTAKELGIKKATQYIELEYGPFFTGQKKVASQSLSFPRVDAYYIDGICIGTSEVPTALKFACAELAEKSASGEILIPDVSSGSGNVSLERVKVGPIEVETQFVGVRTEVKKYSVPDRYLSSISYRGGRVDRS